MQKISNFSSISGTTMIYICIAVRNIEELVPDVLPVRGRVTRVESVEEEGYQAGTSDASTEGETSSLLPLTPGPGGEGDALVAMRCAHPENCSIREMQRCKTLLKSYNNAIQVCPTYGKHFLYFVCFGFCSIKRSIKGSRVPWVPMMTPSDVM